MKISLKLANGAMLEFDGDAAEFERISEFLADPPDSLTAGHGESVVEGPNEESAGVQDGADDGPPLDPRTVLARLQKVGATNDQERMTVMAQLARESGKEGVDFDTLKRLYEELSLAKPAQFPSKTLANAKNSGLLLPVKPGIWRPTIKGENFAKGLGRGTVRSTGSVPSARPAFGNGGGESN